MPGSVQELSNECAMGFNLMTLPQRHRGVTFFREGDCISERCHDFPRATALVCRREYFISDIIFGNCGLGKLIQFHLYKIVYM